MVLTQAGVAIYKPAYYRDITSDELGRIFASSTHVQIPLLDERVKVLHNTSQVLYEVSGCGLVATSGMSEEDGEGKRWK